MDNIDKIILETYKNNPNFSARELGNKLGRSRGTISYRLRKLGIHRDRKIMQKSVDTSRSKPWDISQELESLLLGSILGDSHVTKYIRDVNTPRLNRNSQISFGHGNAQREYLEYKRNLCISFGAKVSPITVIDYSKYEGYNKGGLIHKFNINPNINLNKYRDMFYGKKGIRFNNYLYKMDYRSLAIWIMDDGVVKREGGGIPICTDAFNAKDIEKFKLLFRRRLNIEVSTHYSPSKRGLRLYIPSKYCKELASKIAPYFHESMLYKIRRFLNPVNLGKS